METPIRVPVIAPEQYITPVTSEEWYLITSPELHMKRLLGSRLHPGFFNSVIVSARVSAACLHNPEFTMLEWYRTGGDYLKVIEDAENLVAALAKKLKAVGQG